MANARIISPASQTYRGPLTTPERWATWVPRQGDILVCTPSKCGTTWTQTIIAQLLSGGDGLAGPIPVISPWVDSALGEADEVAHELASQSDRRVVKTHTSADGFPVWEGVHVVAVYRHPLDVFLSLRKHGANMKNRPDHPMNRPVSEAFADYLSLDVTPNDIDRDSLSLLVDHYNRTVASDRLPSLTVLHYADMMADRRGAISGLADALEIEVSDAELTRIVEATGFSSMKAEAASFVPEGGKGFWNNDAAFFDRGGTGKWEGILSDEDLARYDVRMSSLVPDSDTRHWLEEGSGPRI